MGQKLKIWATMTSIILLSGMLAFGFSPDAFARHDPTKPGNGFAIGCDNQGVAKNNPHCSQGLTACDTNGDGIIDKFEIVAQDNSKTLVQAQDLIDLIDGSIAGDGSGFLDTQGEVGVLNGSIEPDCV